MDVGLDVLGSICRLLDLEGKKSCRLLNVELRDLLDARFLLQCKRIEKDDARSDWLTEVILNPKIVKINFGKSFLYGRSLLELSSIPLQVTALSAKVPSCPQNWPKHLTWLDIFVDDSTLR